MKLKFTLLMSLLCFAFFAYAQTNVALNKQVVVSAGGGANAIVDGSTTGGRWESPHGAFVQWAYVDLGAVYNISQIKITWEAAGAKNYLVEVSNDINNWGTPIQNIVNNTTLVNDYTNLAVSGRYVRIYCTERMLPYGYSIYELEVYSTTVPVNLAPKVSLVSPANNAIYATPATIPLEATASDVDGTIAKVEFYNGSTKLGEDLDAPYTYNWENVSGGNYSITAVATDNSGNVTTSGAINVSVELPIVAPQCGGLGMDSDYTYKFSWNNSNPTITFIPNPNRPTNGSSTLIFYYNTTGIDPMPGVNIQPNVPYQLNATDGQTIHFYFVYSTTGGEKNNIAAKHQFVIGSCNSSLNLALHQSIVSSSSLGVAGLATFANDGNNATRWESAHNASQTDAQWIYVDLGDTYNLSAVNILWEGAKAEEYTIQTSNNTSTWTDVLTITGNTAAENNQRNHTLSGTGRYLRIYCTKKTAPFAPYGYSIYEIQAFGTPANGTLPVSLISFNSKLTNNGTVNLTWATSSEQDNAHFLVERSADGKNFTSLQSVASKGSNSRIRLDYQYADGSPLVGQNYYRLTQVDLNGSSKVVGHTVQNVAFTVQHLKLSPNPLAGSEFKINLSGNNANAAPVVISNIYGVVIFSQTVNIDHGIAKINLNNKPTSGIYLVKIADLPAQKLIIK
jgi:chitinase